MATPANLSFPGGLNAYLVLDLSVYFLRGNTGGDFGQLRYQARGWRAFQATAG